MHTISLDVVTGYDRRARSRINEWCTPIYNVISSTHGYCHFLFSHNIVVFISDENNPTLLDDRNVISNREVINYYRHLIHSEKRLD